MLSYIKVRPYDFGDGAISDFSEVVRSGGCVGCVGLFKSLYVKRILESFQMPDTPDTATSEGTPEGAESFHRSPLQTFIWACV